MSTPYARRGTRASGPDAVPAQVASPPTQRVIAVLELLAAEEGAGHTVSTLSARLGLNRATCSAILATLEAAGWVERLADRRYALGAGLVSVAEAVRGRLPILVDAERELAALASDLGYACTLTRAERDHLTLVARHGDPGRLPPGLTIGSRFRLRPPYGAVIMAWRPEAEFAAWLATAAGGPSETEHLRRFVETIAHHGYGVWRLDEHNRSVFEALLPLVSALGSHGDLPEVREQVTRLLGTFGHHGYTAGELDAPTLPVTYVVAPVFDRDGFARYEIEVAVLDPAVERDRLTAITERLLATARALTEAVAVGTTV